MGHIYAAVRRQQYYELKVSYQMKLKYLEERETFAVYDQYAKEYMADKQVEEREEHGESKGMALEDDYAYQLMEAAQVMRFTELKNGAVLDAEEWYRKAARAVAVYRVAAKAQADIDSKYAEYQEEMDEGAHKRVYMMLKEQYDEMGKTELYPFDDGRSPNDTHLTLVAPALRPLPPDMDSVVMMKRYIHKGKAPPRKDLSEGFEIGPKDDKTAAGSVVEQDADKDATEAKEDSAPEKPEPQSPAKEDQVATSIELELSVDPSTLSPDEQVKFLNELASMMGVDPASLSISSLASNKGAD